MGGSAAKKRQALAVAEPFVLHIEDLTHEGRGVARRDGKAVFVVGALPGEEVRCLYTAQRSRCDEARIVEILVPSPERVEPRCAHFGVCGGCALQHLKPSGQVALKQRWLLDSLAHIGKVQPERVLEPMTGPWWGYRRRARLGVKWVAGKGRVLVGFHERHSSYIADLHRCEVLDERVGGLLEELARLIEALSIRDRLPQIEVAGGDTEMGLSFRVLALPSERDREQLRAFGERHGLVLYLQPGGPDRVEPLSAESLTLGYRLPDFDLELAFQPYHFTQVNAAINRQLVRYASELLEIGPNDEVLDLFCGLGNFTLALARRARQVVGVEGDASLVEWAKRNASLNGIKNACFHGDDLINNVRGPSWLRQDYDKILLDPPRSGALELIPCLATLNARRVLYVSCHPATLARDVGELVHRFGYRLAASGIVDMFPHTAHVESMALLINADNASKNALQPVTSPR